MKRRNLSVEEEFFAYGDEGINGAFEERRSGPKAKAASSSLAKVIQILLILVLIAVLVVLGIVGYMYARKAFMSEKSNAEYTSMQKKTSLAQKQPLQQSSASTLLKANVQKVIKTQEQPQVATAIPQKQQVGSVAEKHVAQSSVQMAAHTSASATRSSVAVQEAVQQTNAKISQNVAVAQKSTKLQEAQSSMQKEPSEKSSVAAIENRMKQMSDEELIAYLRSLKPDQLKNLDIEKLIFARKEEMQKGQNNIAVAKTEYLNNQVVIDDSVKANKKSQIAALSQKLSTIVKNTSQKHKNKQYIQGLMQEAQVHSAANRYYVVVPGDTLSKIAKKFYGKGSAYIKIYEANQDIIKDPRLIYPGQKLRIPALIEEGRG